ARIISDWRVCQGLYRRWKHDDIQGSTRERSGIFHCIMMPHNRRTARAAHNPQSHLGNGAEERTLAVGHGACGRRLPVDRGVPGPASLTIAANRPAITPGCAGWL